MANEPGRGANAGGVRMAGARPCPSCGAAVNVNATVCPECGEQLASPTKKIRCRRCHQTASAGLMVCPHCGRDLYPAPSRLLTWGLPALVALLLAGVLLLRIGRSDSPTEWLQRQADRVAALAGSLSNRLQPDVSIALIPAGQDPNDPLVSQAAQAAAQQQEQSQAEPTPAADVDANAGVETATTYQANQNLEAGAPAPSPAAVLADSTAAPAEQATTTPAPTATTPATPTTAPTATAAATTAPTATLAPTATTAPTSTAGPTQTRVVTATALAASAVTPTLAANATTSPAVSLLGLLTPTPIVAAATPTPVGPVIARTVTIGQGDTLFELAQRNDVTLESLLAANELTEDDVYTIQPGDEIKIPAPTPEGAATATPQPGPASYTVRPGDTLAAIAIRQGVSIEELLAANQLTLAQARTLQPGDELVIPSDEPTLPAATPTPVATATATATAVATAAPTATLRATATTAPTATAVSAVRLDAPVLRSPENGTSASCGSGLTLTWQAVPSIRATDQYIVHLGFISGTNGGEQVTWVIAQTRPFNNTAWQPNTDLCALAPQEFDRAWRWYVEVVEKTTDGTQPVSPPSQTWGFTWR